MAGFEVVAKSLSNGDLARAQVAAVLLRLPDASEVLGKREGRIALFGRLVTNGLLAKDWNEDEYPRTGTPPNPGWFAPKDGSGASDGAPGTNGEAGASPDHEAELKPASSVMAAGNDQLKVANITCDELFESDVAICGSAAFAEDFHYKKQCMLGAFQRKRKCLAGVALSPLLPY